MICKGAASSRTFSFAQFVAVFLIILAIPDAFASTPPLFLPTVDYGFAGGITRGISIVDVNGDGLPDLVVTGIADNNDGTIGVLLGTGDGTFAGTGEYYDTGGQAASSAVVKDLNGDGKPDVVVAEACAPGVGNCTLGDTLAGVLLGKGDGTFQQAIVYNTGGYGFAGAVTVGDLNGDGKPDLAVAESQCRSTESEGCVSILMGNGDGSFKAAQAYGAGGLNAGSLILADINNDGRLDLLVTTNIDEAESSVGVLLGNGNGTFLPVVSYRSGGEHGLDFLITDVNKDSKPDVVVRNVYSGSIGVLLGNGDGTFQAAVSYGSGGIEAVSLAVADVNRDGKPDLLVANCSGQNGFCPGIGAVSVLQGNGDGTFRAGVAVYVGSFPSAPLYIAVTDVNGDGKPDIVLTTSFPPTTVGTLLGNGDGAFQPVTFYDSGVYRPTSMSVVDISGDGKPDVVVSGVDRFGQGDIGVLLNSSPPFDTTPPVITLSATPKLLWPPNGRMALVTISGKIADTGSGVNSSSASYAVKDEYDEVQPTGPVSLGPAGNYSFTVLLQASRRGSDLDGRRYTVTVRAKDNAGNRGAKTSVVTVPHDQGP